MDGTFCRTADRGEAQFSYPEPMSWHSKAKHWLDDHNQRRHSPIDLAEVWKIFWWPHWQLSFFLTISEVNTANLRSCSKAEVLGLCLHFRRSKPLHCLTIHLMTMEGHPIFSGKWEGVKWAKMKQKHQNWNVVLPIHATNGSGLIIHVIRVSQCFRHAM